MVLVDMISHIVLRCCIQVVMILVFLIQHMKFQKKKKTMQKTYFETNHMFIMSHFALMYNEFKHFAICYQ